MDDSKVTLRIWVCTDHNVHWPVGGASVVIAKDEKRARELLDARLREKHLKPHSEDPYTLIEIFLSSPDAYILNDGNY